MATPSTRTPVRIARGSYSNLNSSLSDLQDGEIMYAEDQDKLYIKEGSSLVVLTQPAANAVFTGNVTVNAQGDLRLADSDSSNYVGFQSPATVSANVVWTLPDADGSANQLLKTNGSGVLSWGTVDLSTYAPLASPTLTGTPAAPTASANTSTTQIATTAFVMTELGDYAPLAAPAFTGTATGVNLTLSGNLTVNGTTTTIDTTTLQVEDKNIEIGKVSSPSDTTADGGGLTLLGATNKTWNWVNSTDAWTSSEHIALPDDKKLLLGASSDIEIYHNSSNNYDYIKSGTGQSNRYLRVLSEGGLWVRDHGDSTMYFGADTNGCSLYSGGTNRLQTSGTGVTITGTATATAFSGVGTSLTALNASNLASGTVATARLGTGTASSSNFLRGDGSWQTIDLTAYAPLAGATFTGDVQFNGDNYNLLWDKSDNALEFAGWTKATFNSTFQIYRGSGGSDAPTILDTSGNALLMAANGGIEIRAFTSGEKYIKATENGAAELYYDGTKRIETSNTGVTITGTATATTFSGSGASLTTLNASNLSSGTVGTARLGSGTASSSTFLRGDGSWAGAGVTSDAQYNTAAGTNAGDSFSGTSAVNNSLFGYDAGTAITSGDDNTCVGYKAAPALDTGEKNVVVGSNSALALEGGSRNVVLGYEALKLSTGAYGGIYIGFQAGKEMTNGAGNVVIGSQAGVSTTSAAGSVFIGDSAGQNVYTGDNNVCIGKYTFGGNSMSNNIVMGYRAGGFMAGSGVEHNIFMGYEAAFGNSGGSGRANNIGMGYRALYDLTTGDHNICMGNGAGDEITTGASNIGIGQLSLGGWDQITAGTGDNNVAIGQKTMGKWTTGSQNTCIGYQAGEDLTTGGMNVFIGASASRTSANASTCSYSVSIGEGSNVRNGTNNIAIGNNADCGSGNTNTIVLGNTSITSFSVPGVSLSATSSGVSDAKGNLRSVPTRNETSAYTLVAADAGKCINADNGVTVPNGVFAAGDVITIINMATSNKTITQASGLTMRNVGDDGNTGNVSVKKYAMCTLIFTSSSVCFFSTTAKA